MSQDPRPKLDINKAIRALDNQPLQVTRRHTLRDKAKANTPPKLETIEAEAGYIRPVPPKDLSTRLRLRRMAKGGKARRV